MYKIINDHVDICKDLFIPCDSRLRSEYYQQLMMNTDSYKFSIFLSEIKLYPFNVNCFDQFCNLLKQLYLCVIIICDFCTAIQIKINKTCTHTCIHAYTHIFHKTISEVGHSPGLIT